MNPVAEIFVLIYRGNDVRVKIARERSRKLNSLHPSRRNRTQQTTERSRTLETLKARCGSWSIAIYVLANQVNLFVAMAAQFVNLSDDVGSRATLFAAA